MSALRTKTEHIRKMALDEGFLMAGFTKAEELTEEKDRLQEWLGMSYHGKMGYMENHFEKRTDPQKLVPGTQTVICLAYNYHTEKEQTNPEAFRVSSYAFGRDYHKVIKKRMKTLIRRIAETYGPFNCRAFVDSAPVLERDLAKRSGLGWTGKNTMLIHPGKGSRFFLSEIFVDFELEYDEPLRDYCGTCTRCIDACPTDAILGESYTMDASKCISYLTIELKDDVLPSEFNGKMENWIFGCDICQDVCPWNRFSKSHSEEEFEPSEKLFSMTRQDWIDLDEEGFNKLFEGSAVKRTGYAGLKRNINFIEGSVNE